MKRSFIILAVSIFISFLNVGQTFAQLGRCCFGNPISPACEMQTEMTCGSHAGFISWFADSNCVNNPCPASEWDSAIVAISYESPTWNVGLDATLEVEVWLKTTVAFCASSATFKPNRNIVIIDSVIWGDTLLEAFENDSILNMLRIANDTLLFEETITYFVPGFVAYSNPILPAITPTDDPILLATAYVSMKPDSLGVIPPGDSIPFSVDSVTLPPAFEFLYTDLRGYSVYPDFSGGSIWLKNPAYLCGDCNGDWETNISDAVWIVNYIFAGGTPPQPLEAGDVNCDGVCNVSDAVYIINFVFIGGNDPCDPDGDGIPDC